MDWMISPSDKSLPSFQAMLRIVERDVFPALDRIGLDAQQTQDAGGRGDDTIAKQLGVLAQPARRAR